MQLNKAKTQLLDRIRGEHRKFEDAITGLSESQMTSPGVQASWSVKDIAAHLTYWQQRAIFLLECARDGWQPQKDRWSSGSVDERNAQNYEANKDRPLADVLADLRAAQVMVIHLIEATSEADLVTKGRFSWLPDQALAEKIRGETCEHYQEHYESLREWRAEHK